MDATTTRHDELAPERLRLDAGGSRLWIVAAATGLAGLGAAAILARGSEHGAESFFRSYLLNFAWVLSLALGALFFVLITHLTRAGWSVALRRLAEVVAWAVLPLAGLALVIVLGLHHLYEWTHQDVVAADALLSGKRVWLNTTFFTIRLAVYFTVWSATAGWFLRTSTRQDSSRDPELTLRMERFAAPAMILYAITLTFAAFDLLMSLNPHWYSTIFGVYYFAGSVLGFFALIPVLLAVLRSRDRLARVIATEHFHDVGKLMFAFVVFWAYIAFSQYMLIWYGNVPEETIWYLVRQSGPWTGLSLVLLFGHFVLPFFGLISRHPKRRRGVLVVAAVWLLAMHWIDLLYIVMPEARPQGPPIRAMDVACFVGLTGLFFAAVLWRLSRVNLLPVGDPRLHESLKVEHG